MADALSRKADFDDCTSCGVSDAHKGSLCMVSFPSPAWLTDLKASYTFDQQVQDIFQAFQLGKGVPKGYAMQNGLLLYKGKIYLRSCDALKVAVLQQVHDSPLGGHSGFLKTLHRVQRDFYWLGLRSDLKKHVRECDTCQRLKYETCHVAGLLQPLSIPNKPWLNVSVDFVEGHPKSQSKDVVLVVVDRLAKFVHYIPLSHPYITAKVGNLYLEHVFKLHGMPATIVSDRDLVFTSHFWQELIRLQGVQLAMTSAYHPQSVGKTKVVNKSTKHYLRAFAANRPQTWVEWLPLAELWFNTNFHTSTKLTPFEALFGYPPPKLLDYILSTTKVDSMDVQLRTRQQLLALSKHNLVAAQERMKVNADKHKTEREFAKGD